MLLINWLENLTNRMFAPGKRRKCRKDRSRIAHYHQAAGIEVLEDRTLLSTIRRVNRGTTGDGFTSVFGTGLIDTNNDGTADTQRDTVARRVIDAAINAWERVIDDFNYSDGTNTFDLTVSMFPNGTGFRAQANFPSNGLRVSDRENSRFFPCCTNRWIGPFRSLIFRTILTSEPPDPYR